MLRQENAQNGELTRNRDRVRGIAVFGSNARETSASRPRRAGVAFRDRRGTAQALGDFMRGVAVSLGANIPTQA